MRDWIEEWCAVFLYSTRAKICLTLGIFGFIFMFILGDWITGSFEFHGPLASMTEYIRSKLLHRYEHAAWGILGSFLVATIGILKRDRKRLLGE